MVVLFRIFIFCVVIEMVGSWRGVLEGFEVNQGLQRSHVRATVKQCDVSEISQTTRNICKVEK